MFLSSVTLETSLTKAVRTVARQRQAAVRRIESLVLLLLVFLFLMVRRLVVVAGHYEVRGANDQRHRDKKCIQLLHYVDSFFLNFYLLTAGNPAALGNLAPPALAC